MGGGSGGHITPIVAVVDKLRRNDSNSKSDIRVWCDRKFSKEARELFGQMARVDVIASGKFRRYANLSIWTKLRHHIFRTYLANFIDLFKIAFGILQSCVKLIIWRPNVIFLKGGYVCLPVGIAARFLRIPTVIHDSDTTPGLANRILARWAAAIGTGSPVENYPNYPKKLKRFVGVPINDKIHKFSEREQLSAKKELNFNTDKKLIFVTGGGQGAVSLNSVIDEIATKIIANNAQILLTVGRGNVDKIMSSNTKDFMAVEFLTDEYLAALSAADIVIVRAGATTMAEMAAAGKAAIIVPNPHLSGDHQTKNAKVYEDAHAAIVLKQDEISENPDIMENAIIELLYDAKLRETLAKNLAKFAKPNALNDIVEMILQTAKKGKK